MIGSVEIITVSNNYLTDYYKLIQHSITRLSLNLIINIIITTVLMIINNIHKLKSNFNNLYQPCYSLANLSLKLISNIIV